jgi:DNA-binding LacI/PurR family transcriptional regulator
MSARPVPRQATLDDVARVAGVSRSTASRVIAGYGPASAGVRERVRAAAARLGYAPDPAARALVTGSGYRIAVAVAGASSGVLDDPYVDRVVSSVATACAPAGVGVSLEWLPFQPTTKLDRLAADRSVRGVLLVNTTEPILCAVPAALCGRVASIGINSPAVPSFDVDNAGAVTAIVERLLRAGRRRIAMVTGPRWLPCTRRPVDAYRDVMRAAALPARTVPGDFTSACGRVAVLEVLDRWPDTDAVVAGNDAMALGALAELRGRGVDVPDDIAVTGFDDIPFAALSAPALTTATHPVERIAHDAVMAVLDRAEVAPVNVYASELVPRESA